MRDVKKPDYYCQGLTIDEPVEALFPRPTEKQSTTQTTQATVTSRPAWVGEVMTAVLGKKCKPHDTSRL